MMYAYAVSTKRSLVVAVVALAVVMSGQRAQAQPGTVLSHQKISSTQGNGPPLGNNDRFGISVASLGDLDGDEVGDLAVGALWDDDGGFNRGAVWILFLNAEGTVKSHQKISDTEGGFKGILSNDDAFGHGVASLGDLDGDGIGDLAVGPFIDNDGGTDRGAVWILFLNTDGTVKSHQKISDTEGGFKGILHDGDKFGHALASLGDLDGDGPSVLALAAGAVMDDDGNINAGAMWVLFLNSDGTVNSHQKISETQGGFTGKLDVNDQFGHGPASLGDLDGDGIGDLVVGATLDDDGAMDNGAVWILFLNTNGTVKSHQKISATEGGGPPLGDGDACGHFAAYLGDLDGDGIGDLAVAAHRSDDGGLDRGSMWNLFLSTDGTVKAHQKISDTEGGFKGILDNLDNFGLSVASLGDLDGDGVGDLAVGAWRDDDGGLNRGAVWILFLDGICLWDLDASGSVGVSDFLELLGAWGPCPPKGDCPADFDGSGDVGVSDFLALLGAWGPCP